MSGNYVGHFGRDDARPWPIVRTKEARKMLGLSSDIALSWVAGALNNAGVRQLSSVGASGAKVDLWNRDDVVALAERAIALGGGRK